MITQLTKACMIVKLVVLLSVSSNVMAQNSVVVIPLGSDVSAQQFNALVDQVNQSHVFSGHVNSNGSKGGTGHYTTSRIEEGVYDVTVIPPLPQYAVANFNLPNVVVTSQNVARIPSVQIMDLLSDRIRFRVTLRAFDSNIADASFFFHVQFAEFSGSLDGPSDRRLKTNVKKLGTTSQGHNVYRFNYANDAAQTDFVGLMAQELLSNHADAVNLGKDGFYSVDYFQLGLRMATLEHWQEYGMGAVELRHGG